MTEKEIVTKNLILSSEFDRYIFEHPDIAESIPLDAQIVFLPQNVEAPVNTGPTPRR